MDETENKAPFLNPIFPKGLIFAQSKERCLGRGITLGDIVGLQNACKATNTCDSFCSALGKKLGLNSQSKHFRGVRVLDGKCCMTPGKFMLGRGQLLRHVLNKQPCYTAFCQCFDRREHVSHVDVCIRVYLTPS